MPSTWIRTTKKGDWTEDKLKDAFKFIDEGHSISSPSRLYNIPFRTLQEPRPKNQIAEPVLNHSATFSIELEKALADRVKTLEDMFHGITALHVRKVAFQFTVNRAYLKVATTAVAVSGFTKGIQPFDSSIFTDVNFLAADEFINMSNNSLPQMKNDELGQPTANQSAGNIQAKHSADNNQGVQQPERHVNVDDTYAITFDYLIPIPGPINSKLNDHRREKQKPDILTSTPKKKDLEMKIEKRQNKDLKKQNANLKKKLKNKKIKMTKRKAKKTLVFRETDSSEEDQNKDMKEMCDDDELDDLGLTGTEDESTCFICEEFGQDGEEWYSCTSCAIWIHALCSTADNPVGFNCDKCIKLE